MAYTLLRNANDSSTSQLFVDALPTDQFLLGQWLEGQHPTPVGDLLFIVDDSFQEDSLNIYLLDPQHHVRDHIRLQRMYAAGQLRGLRQPGEGRFEFSFFGDDRWLLRVLPEPRLGLHVPFPLREHHRDHLFGQHWLALRRLRGSPQPAEFPRQTADSTKDRPDA